MAVLRRDGELSLSRNTRKNGARFNRDGPRGPTNLFWARKRPLFFQAHYRIDSPRNRLRDGGLHGKEAGSARHDRELPGAAKSLNPGDRWLHFTLFEISSDSPSVTL